MTVTFDASAFHANMQGYQKELLKASGNPKMIKMVAAECLENARTKVPETHMLRALFDALGTMVGGKTAASEKDISEYMTALTTKIEKIVNRSSLKTMTKEAHPVAVAAFANSTTTESFLPAAAAPSPAAPPATLSSPLHMPDCMKKMSQMEVSLFATNGKCADLATHTERVSQRVDDLDKSFSQCMTTVFVDQPKLRLELDEFRSGLGRYRVELTDCQRTQEAINIRLAANPAMTLEPRVRALEAARKTELEVLQAEKEAQKIHFDQEMRALKTEMAALRIGLGTLRSEMGARPEFVQFTITRWSTVLAVPTDSRKGTSPVCTLFGNSYGQSLKAWGREFWLKVDKTATQVGLYLCCGEEGCFPFKVKYQLMVKRRSSDDGVCASRLFDTEFGKDKAWGLAKLAIHEEIEKEGGYYRGEDAITFGCWIYPVEGLTWGQNAAAGALAAGPVK